MLISTEIIENCKKGDQSAYRRLYESTVPYVYSVIKRYVYDSSIHKDMVQETYAQLYSNIGKYDLSRGEFKPFLRKVTVNCCLMYLRKSKNVPVLNAIDDINEPHITDQHQEAFNNLRREDIERLLNEMPKGYKTIFLLHVIDELAYEEIAEMLNMAKGTVRSQFFRAKKWIINKSVIDTKSSAYGLF